MVTPPDETTADPYAVIAALRAERDAALAREAALAEVLDLINRSTAEAQPVFDKILEKAHSLCDAAMGALLLYSNELIWAVATRGYSGVAGALARQPRALAPEQQGLALGQRVVQITGEQSLHDVNSDFGRAFVELTGARVYLMVPLRKDGELLGAISVVRQELRPFSEQDIALLESFAEQAVIAMENARLTTELRQRTDELAKRNSEYGERIEHQSATIDVLKAMSASPGDAQPVFSIITRRARELCSSSAASLLEFDGELVHLRSFIGGEEFAKPGARENYERLFPMVPTRALNTSRAILDRQIVHVHDLAAQPEQMVVVLNLGQRSQIAVPLLRDGAAIGTIALASTEVGGFSDSQVELLKTFAEQAVIAITSAETYRSLQSRTSDLQQSLEYQTATSDVLKVISRSTFDLQPMLNTLVQTAGRLCDADQAVIYRREGDLVRLGANFGFPPEYEAYYKDLGDFPADPQSQTTGHRAWCERQPVHIHDVTTVPGYGEAPIKLGKVRTSLGVPLLRAGEAAGVMVLARQRVEPFTDRQIELVRTFADQAVIAIENTRLLTEQREALEQQTATAEVLQVINSSPGNLTPVFDAMLQRAMKLCEADYGHIHTYDDQQFDCAAIQGEPEFVAWRRQRNPIRMQGGDGNSTLERIVAGNNVVHFSDALLEPAYSTNPPFRAMVDASGVRSTAAVALRKEQSLWGTIVVYRREVRPFTEKQIALLQNFAAQAVIAMENARLITEQREALERQTATAEVLQVINSSPGDLAPVFEALLDKAMHLCQANFGILATYDGEWLTRAALRGVPASYADYAMHERVSDAPDGVAGRLLRGASIVHVPDLMAEAAYRDGNPDRRALVDLGGARTCLSLALRKEDALLGMISFYRQEVRPFNEHQIALLRNFAAQAVIAMDNARLLTDQREALEQQTATAEVLQVINASPGDLAPVFEALLDKAMHLCEANFGVLLMFDGEHIRPAVFRGVQPAYSDYAMNNVVSDAPETSVGRIVRGADIVHIPDLMAEAAYQNGRPDRLASVELAGARTVLSVALRKDNTLLGMIVFYRQEVRPFNERQIALLQSFAAQAVIAMENARLLGQLRQRTADLQQSLEYQTATSDVLKVISRSTFDLQPVLDTVVETAARLCTAEFGHLALRDGDVYRPFASFALSPEFEQFVRQVTFTPGRGSVVERVLLEARPVQINDITTDPEYALPQVVSLGNVRSILGVPLLREGTPIGVFALCRQRVEPFTDRQIELVSTFADQAVIAIENMRLITEQREALEQQTATTEVLQAINSSPGELAPVFGAMLEKATRLCDAAFGLMSTYDGRKYHTVATHGIGPDLAEFMRNPPHPDPESALGRIEQGEDLVLFDDIADTDVYRRGEPRRRAIVELGGARSYAVVALRKDRRLLGIMAAYRRQVRPFEHSQVALLKNFASQAVIAMENARLINETREALEQQTATAEVLQVINASPGNLVPVFDAVLERALRLCGGSFGTLLTYDGEHLKRVAFLGVPPAFIEYDRRNPLTKDAVLVAQGIATGKPVQAADIMTDARMATSPSVRDALVELGGVRALLQVPLVKDGAVVGFIAVWRREPGVFPDKQVALVEGFAAQAVIAMENARLITEQREALEQQTATAEVLQVINTSPGDLAPVFDALLEKALRLCDAAFGNLWTYDGELGRLAAICGASPEYRAELTRAGPQKPEQGASLLRLVEGEPLVHIADITAEGAHRSSVAVRRMLAERAGARTVLWVPLRKDGVLLGFFTIYRTEVRPFTDKQIALLKTFAAQAVVAMENARLLTEQREALEQQTATAEVLQVINASPGDLKPVFDAILQKAHTLCGAEFGSLFLCDGKHFRAIVSHDVPEALVSRLREGIGNDTWANRQLIAGEPFVHIHDSALEEHAVYRGMDMVSSHRTLLSVPLRKSDGLLGKIVAGRLDVRPFTDKQIALLQNFATQAVIAMENARLLTEQREALEQQTATAEVLQVINSSLDELGPVFETLLDRAMRLCGANFGELHTFDGERLREAASHGVPRALAEFRRNSATIPTPGPTTRRMRDGANVIHTADLMAETPYREGDPHRRALVDLGGARTVLAVALRKDNRLLGAINIYRQEVNLFSDRQVALLQSFAAQAVIAMENARLLGELRQRQDELRITFDNMGDGVAMFDAGRRLAAWNRNFQELLDIPDAILDEYPSYADYLHLLAERGEFRTEEVEVELARRLEHTDRELRLERTRPDGRVIEVRRNAVPDGGFVLIYSDITERKRSEEEVRAARDASEAALRELKAAQANLIQAEKMASLGQLTAGIAHEIKNPLNFVNNFASLSVDLLDELKQTAAPSFAMLDAERRAEIDDLTRTLASNLEKINEHGNRADAIVRSMLEHSRSSSGERRSVNLNTLVDEALNLAYHGARAQDQSFSITLQREFDGGIAPITLTPQDITRVLLNLFSNGFYAARRRQSVEAVSGFEPTLSVTTRELGDVVEIRVRDNGIGIPEEVKDKLFQPFFTTKPTGEGTGLGLSISYDIVTQQHGGSITVDSRVGEYSEFTIRLPRNQ